MVGHRTTLSNQASCKWKCHVQKNSESWMLSFSQTITERVHIEKRYGPRRQSTSLDDDSDIQVQIRGKKIWYFWFLTRKFKYYRLPRKMFCVLKFYFSFDNNSKYFWENKIQVFLFIKLANKTREMEEFTCLFPFLLYLNPFIWRDFLQIL